MASWAIWQWKPEEGRQILKTFWLSKNHPKWTLTWTNGRRALGGKRKVLISCIQKGHPAKCWQAWASVMKPVVKSRFLQLRITFFVFILMPPHCTYWQESSTPPNLGIEEESIVVSMLANNHVKIFINLSGIMKTLGEISHVSVQSAFISMLISTSQNKKCSRERRFQI